MAVLTTPTRRPASAGAAEGKLTRAMPAKTAPIIAAVDGSSASRGAVEFAVKLATELKAPLVFVYVRRGPFGLLGTPFFQRRRTAAMSHARRILAKALRSAERAGVAAEGEILEGAPRKRILELAADREARLIVVARSSRPLLASAS